MAAVRQTRDDLPQTRGISPKRPPWLPEFPIAQAPERNAEDGSAVVGGETLPVLALTERQTTVEMVVAEVRIYQPVGQATPTITTTPVPLIAQPIQAYTPFALEAILVATGPTSGSPFVYGAQFYARDLNTGQKSLLGHTQATMTNNCYRFALANAILEPGTYRIQICMTIRGAPGLGYLELPRLRVA